MKILLSGNIASGKGTLIKSVIEKLPDYEHLAIDDYREKYGDHTEDGEIRAREQFIFDLRWCENCIIECTGVGRLYSQVKPEIDANFLLLTPVKECEKRFKDRGTEAVLPSNWFKNSSLAQSLNYISECHKRTKYKLTIRGNASKDVARMVSKINVLQKRNTRIH
jgi:predicted kinase